LNPAPLPYNNDYSDFDSNTDLAFADEFKGQIIIQQLNLLCDGYCHFNTKGGSTQISKKFDFLLSNLEFLLSQVTKFKHS